MTTRQRHARIKPYHILYTSYVSIAILSYFTSYPLVFNLLTIVCVISFGRQFLVDKKEVQDALNYARVPIPFWKSFFNFTSLFPLIFGSNYLLELLGIGNPNGIGIIYLCVCTIVLIFEYEHKNFIHSIRSFDEGVKLTGRAAHTIPWRDIHRIHLNEKKVEFLLQNDIKAFRVDQRDLDEMEAIIAVWKEKKQIVLRKGEKKQ